MPVPVVKIKEPEGKEKVVYEHIFRVNILGETYEGRIRSDRAYEDAKSFHFGLSERRNMRLYDKEGREVTAQMKRELFRLRGEPDVPKVLVARYVKSEQVEWEPEVPKWAIKSTPVKVKEERKVHRVQGLFVIDVSDVKPKREKTAAREELTFEPEIITLSKVVKRFEDAKEKFIRTGDITGLVRAVEEEIGRRQQLAAKEGEKEAAGAIRIGAKGTKEVAIYQHIFKFQVEGRAYYTALLSSKREGELRSDISHALFWSSAMYDSTGNELSIYDKMALKMQGHKVYALAHLAEIGL